MLPFALKIHRLYEIIIIYAEMWPSIWQIVSILAPDDRKVHCIVIYAQGQTIKIYAISLFSYFNCFVVQMALLSLIFLAIQVHLRMICTCNVQTLRYITYEYPCSHLRWKNTDWIWWFLKIFPTETVMKTTFLLSRYLKFTIKRRYRAEVNGFGTLSVCNPYSYFYLPSYNNRTDGLISCL